MLSLFCSLLAGFSQCLKLEYPAIYYTFAYYVQNAMLIKIIHCQQ